MHYLQLPTPQTQYPATYICPLWWVIWWGSKWYSKTCTKQTDATAAWVMRTAVSCIMWSSQREGPGGGVRLSRPLPAGSDILGTNSHNNNDNNNICVLFAGLAETVSRSRVNALDRIVFDVFLHSWCWNREREKREENEWRGEKH